MVSGSTARRQRSPVKWELAKRPWRSRDFCELHKSYAVRAARTYSSTLPASTSSVTFPPSTTASLNALSSKLPPSAAVALARPAFSVEPGVDDEPTGAECDRL